MGWFDEQIKQRIRQDDEAFAEGFACMADAIMGQRLSDMLHDDRGKTKSAIDEILKYYHVKSQELPDNISNTADQLEYLLRPTGIMWRTVELEGQWYKDAVGAMLGTRRDDGSAVALIPRGFSGYDFFDVKSGKRIKLNRKTASMVDGEAICFYKPFPLKELGIKDLLKYIASVTRISDYLLIVFATLAVTLVGLLPPYINNIIYSDVINYHSMQVFVSVFIFLLCASISQTLIEAYKTLVLERLTAKMNVAFQAAGMSRLLSLPASFFKGYSAGDLASRMSYIGQISSMLVNSVLSIGLMSVFSLAYIPQMAYYGPGLVLPGLVVILATVLVSVVSVLVQARLSRRIMEQSGKEYGLSYSLVAGVQKIRLAGAEKRAFAKWAKTYAPLAKLTYDPPMVLKVSQVVSACIGLVGALVIYYFSVKTEIPLADYYSFQSAYGMVMGAFTALIGIAGSFAQIRPVMELLNPIFKTVPEVGTGKKAVDRLNGAIELNHVSFRYTDDMPNVIDDLSLKIRPGQYVAIVGKTGCGKSTLMRLLLGFETPQKGAVYYDGKDLNTLDLKSLRQKIGVVMQDGKLFQGDIYSNIIISAPWLTQDEAWEAAEMAGMGEDIRNMPMGMHTVISEGSGGVSGGQRQRLMIARAIAPKPKILMFDEATSALDNLTQKTVSDSLAGLKCTRIVIAHRLSTIKQCDRILVLDKGSIVEEGTYDELIRQGGFFAGLVARQRLDGERE
ncbi:MAG: NHLP bacteriocin export ABC transporter permease/ATPase subunit [Eubacteriales bacterium]|nr:NHLP bacteriocin export ABC transporter permease/ATPase subunit [Eubacteriales bacterium]